MSFTRHQWKQMRARRNALLRASLTPEEEAFIARVREARALSEAMLPPIGMTREDFDAVLVRFGELGLLRDEKKEGVA